MTTKAEATRLGKALVKRLGPGWTLRVWENLGWHYSATCAGMSVYPAYGGGFHTLLSAEAWKNGGPGGGEVYWSGLRARTFKDPRRAVADQLQRAQVFVDRAQLAIDEVRIRHRPGKVRP